MEIDVAIKQEIDTLFRELDVNKDGHISEEELYSAMSASSHNRRTRQEVRELMRKLDTNADGVLSYDEFLAFMQTRIKEDILNAEDEMQDLRAKFKECDSNGNGWLSLTEMWYILL